MNNTGNGKHNRILVVDDEPRILRFVRLSLVSYGFDVITASDGDNALKLLDAEKRELEDGQGSPHMPVIVFSARSSVAEQAFNLGANDFICKPFIPEEMAEKIRNAIG
jgi:DNA-binding response OmpR family regulator